MKQQTSKEVSLENPRKAVTFMAWFAYVIIFFEMLYMATPFAVFFYSVYKFPLQFLNTNPITGTMVQTILPHFIRTDNILINGLLFISWPLMLSGLIVFLIGFVQIYWSKFTKKAAVTGGVYGFIRHPQYLAWSVFGLGMAIYWSRIIIWAMYVTMLFVYYFLARHEENECMRKYGDSYKQYYNKTGMFFFKLPFKAPSFFRLPKARAARILIILTLYVLTVSLTIEAGLLFKGYVINNLSIVTGPNYNAVSATVMKKEKMEKILQIASNNALLKSVYDEVFTNSGKKLYYIVPEQWHVSELGLNTAPDRSHSGSNPALDPTSHGNAVVVNPDRYMIVFSSVVTGPNVTDQQILYKTRQQKPRLVAHVDLSTGKVTSFERAPESGMYGEIPVPVY